MKDWIVSPDGTKVWSGHEWITLPDDESSQSIEISDSIVQGGIQQTTNINVHGQNKQDEIANLLELAVMKLEQEEISEFDRIFTRAKEYDVESAIQLFESDKRVLGGLLRNLEYKISFLVDQHKIIYSISGGDIGNKILIQTQGNLALVLVTKAERFSIFNPALFHAVASSLYTIMSEFDLIWKKKLMKSEASRHYNTAVGLIQKRSPGYKMAVSRLDGLIKMKSELQDHGTDKIALTLLLWSIAILGGLYLLAL
jgi:hypothetical protein